MSRRGAPPPATVVHRPSPDAPTLPLCGASNGRPGARATLTVAPELHAGARWCTRCEATRTRPASYPRRRPGHEVTLPAALWSRVDAAVSAGRAPSRSAAVEVALEGWLARAP